MDAETVTLRVVGQTAIPLNMLYGEPAKPVKCDGTITEEMLKHLERDRKHGR